MNRFLLAAINAKYIHSNPAIYSLKAYVQQNRAREAPRQERTEALDRIVIDTAEYTINQPMEQILENIYRRQPDMIGFSCYIWNMAEVLKLVHELHKVLPAADIWLGGPEVSYDAPVLLKKEPEILGVMKGEGEEIFTRLLDAYEILGGSLRRWEMSSGSPASESGTFPDKGAAFGDGREQFWEALAHIPGIVCRTGSGEDAKIRDSAAGPAPDLNRIPFFYSAGDFNLEDFANRIIYYESSRGCPFSCSYCLSSAGRSVRFRDLNLVRSELQFFLDRRVRQVKFVDRTFNCRKSHAMEIWRYLSEHDNGVTNFHFEIAADLLDEEELSLLAQLRPGLVQLEIGVQSTNPATIKAIRRDMNLDRLKRTVARIHAGGNIHQHLDLIAGLPYEDYDTFHKSFNEVYEMEPDQLQLGFLKLLKGSLLYEEAPEYALVCRESPPYEVLSTRWLPYEDLLRLKRIEDMLEVYYNSGQFSRTMGMLVRMTDDAFAVYEALAEYYGRHNLYGYSHTRAARYEIMYEFIQEYRKENTGDAKGGRFSLEDFGDALTMDMYLRENCKSRPYFALDQTRYREQVKKLVPELRRLGTQIHAEVMRSGEIWLFDYRNRDPLTRNAALRRIGRAV